MPSTKPNSSSWDVNHIRQASLRIFMKEVWPKYTPFEKIRWLVYNSPESDIAKQFRDVFESAELDARLCALFPWFEPDDPRSESRLATHLATRVGVTWWRDLKNLQEKIGVTDELFHQQLEPLLAKIGENPDTESDVKSCSVNDALTYWTTQVFKAKGGVGSLQKVYSDLRHFYYGSGEAEEFGLLHKGFFMLQEDYAAFKAAYYRGQKGADCENSKTAKRYFEKL